MHVVIIGLTRAKDAPPEKRLFSYDDVNGEPVESRHRALSPYLFDASALINQHTVVESQSEPICDTPKVIIGSKPIDGGQFIFSDEKRATFLAQEPKAEQFLRPYIGAEEFINRGRRWILALHDVSPEELRSMPSVLDRVSKVRAYRLESPSKPTQALAQTPTLYHVNVVPKSPYLVIPKVSSERRAYAPIGWLEPPVVPSDLLLVVANTDKRHFAVLTSAMHMAWLREVGGRLESRYRYSIGVVYNTFPWPELSDADKEKLNATGQAILDARAQFPNATLADLYDPDTMPAVLRRAHQENDRAVDRLYRKAPFTSDRERVEHLFMLYEKLRAPLEVTAKTKPKRGGAK